MRDTIGNQGTFAATTPADKASPVRPASSTMTRAPPFWMGKNGQLATNDTLQATLSEGITIGLTTPTTITEASRTSATRA